MCAINAPTNRTAGAFPGRPFDRLYRTRSPCRFALCLIGSSYSPSAIRRTLLECSHRHPGEIRGVEADEFGLDCRNGLHQGRL